MYKWCFFISFLLLLISGFFCLGYVKSHPAVKILTNDEWYQVDSVRKKVEEGSFEIDLKGMNVVCIKRTFNQGHYCTYIMYKNKDSTLTEKYFTCSEEKHKELVEQFKRQLGNF